MVLPELQHQLGCPSQGPELHLSLPHGSTAGKLEDSFLVLTLPRRCRRSSQIHFSSLISLFMYSVYLGGQLGTRHGARSWGHSGEQSRWSPHPCGTCSLYVDQAQRLGVVCVSWWSGSLPWAPCAPPRPRCTSLSPFPALPTPPLRPIQKSPSKQGCGPCLRVHHPLFRLKRLSSSKTIMVCSHHSSLCLGSRPWTIMLGTECCNNVK